MQTKMNALSTQVDKLFRSAVSDWIRPVGHADVVLQVMPVWAPARIIQAIAGVNRPKLIRMCQEKKVSCKKLDGNVVYKVSDVLAVIESMEEKFK